MGDVDKALSAWEGSSDFSDGENKNESDSEWGGFDDSNSEWGGFGDFAESPKLEHVSIVNKLLQDISQTPTLLQLSRGVARYDVFVNNPGGTDAVRDQVSASLDSDLFNLIETRELRLETLKELKVKKPGISNRPGIYVHIIYNPDDLDDVGIYVRSAKLLAARIKIHKKEQKNVNRRQEREGRQRKTKIRSPTVHQKFCAREGYRDFWLCFAELDPPQSAIEKYNMNLKLNIVEKYSAPLFRSLAR